MGLEQHRAAPAARRCLCAGCEPDAGCAHLSPGRGARIFVRPQAVPSTEPRATTVSNTIPTGRVDVRTTLALASTAPPVCRASRSGRTQASKPRSIGGRVRRRLVRVVAVHDPPAQQLACGEPSEHRIGWALIGADDRRSTLSAGLILRRAEQPQRGGRGSRSAGHAGRCRCQMNSNWAPSVFSMKSEALMMASTSSRRSASTRWFMSADIRHAQRWPPAATI